METVGRRIKVVHVVTRMNTGGVAVLIAELFKGYDRNTFDFTLIAGTCQANEENYIEARGLNLGEVSIASMSRPLNPLKDFMALIGILRVLYRLKPDIVHTHTSKAGLLGRIAAKIACPRAKVVHTFHGHLLEGYFSKLKTLFLIFTEKYLAHISDLLLSMGNFVKNELLRVGIGVVGKYRVVYPGLAEPQIYAFNEDVEAFRLKHADEVICTFTGRLSPIKRCDRIIELAQLAILQEKSILFVIIGDGELRNELEARSKNLPISFLGWQNNVEQWLAISDISILLSDNEAVPLAMIEAGFAGLPVVATNVGSMADVVIDGINGFLTSKKIDDIASALLKLIEEPELRRKMGTVGKGLARMNFSTQAMIAVHQDVYSQLMLRDN